MTNQMKTATGKGRDPADPGLALDTLLRLVRTKGVDAGVKTKDAANSLAAMAEAARARGDQVEARVLLETALALLEEVHRWMDAYTSARNSGRNTVRTQRAQADACAVHGEGLRAMREQLTALQARLARVEMARAILWRWATACQEFVTVARTRRGVQGLPTAEATIAWMEKQLPKVRNAHRAVLNPNTNRESQ